jgi:hypothetical protein
MLQQASRYRADGALLNPPGKNAAELYHRVLAADPANQVAAQGLDEVVSQLVAQANTMLASGDLATVRGLVDRASAVGLDQQSVNRLKSRLDVEIARRDDVQRKLDQAANLLQRGFITEPAERNAVALLRDVERLDPSNGQARELLRRGAERLAQAAQDARAAGLSRDAQQYLELALTVAPDVAKWRDLRAQWEQSDASL